MESFGQGTGNRVEASGTIRAAQSPTVVSESATRELLEFEASLHAVIARVRGLRVVSRRSGSLGNSWFRSWHTGCVESFPGNADMFLCIVRVPPYRDGTP